METLLLERQGPVGWLRLNRPDKLNAQNQLMWQELRALGDELVDDADLRCLVVTGEGRSFSAGLDLSQLSGADSAFTSAAASPAPSEGAGGPDRLVESILDLQRAFTWLAEAPFATVAAVRGHALGAGLQLALACDLRIFATDAKVGVLELRLGLLPDLGGTEWLPRIVGLGRAKELVLTGEQIDAAESLRIGLANRVVEPAELDTAAAELAERLAGQPPIAVRGSKRALDAAFEAPGTSLRRAAEGQAACLRSSDFAEAGAAFLEGRPPTYQGR